MPRPPAPIEEQSQEGEHTAGESDAVTPSLAPRGAYDAVPCRRERRPRQLEGKLVQLAAREHAVGGGGALPLRVYLERQQDTREREHHGEVEYQTKDQDGEEGSLIYPDDELVPVPADRVRQALDEGLPLVGRRDEELVLDHLDGRGAVRAELPPREVLKVRPEARTLVRLLRRPALLRGRPGASEGEAVAELVGGLVAADVALKVLYLRLAHLLYHRCVDAGPLGVLSGAIDTVPPAVDAIPPAADAVPPAAGTRLPSTGTERGVDA